MTTGRIGIYEHLVLKPLSILCIFGAIAYYVQRSWGMGIFLTVVVFIVGVIGVTVNRSKSFAELARGTSSSDRDSPVSEEASFSEAKKVVALATCTFWIVAIAVSVVAHHHGTRWFLAIPVGAGVAVLNILPGMIFSMRPTAKH